LEDNVEIEINDEIELEKSGDVIPKVSEALVHGENNWLEKFYTHLTDPKPDYNYSVLAYTIGIFFNVSLVGWYRSKEKGNNSYLKNILFIFLIFFNFKNQYKKKKKKKKIVKGLIIKTIIVRHTHKHTHIYI
jgi:hypothetical protein